jgi:O-antigen biosynthesis protein
MTHPTTDVTKTIQSRIQTGPILVIAGMHRSGTSYVSSILKESGLHVGTALDSGSAGNVKGHFENMDFVTSHAKVLKHHSLSASGWTVKPDIDVPESFYADMEKTVLQNVQTTPWGWKDPRTTLFLNFWSSELPDAKFLFVYRSPWEVIDSLYRRGDKAFQENPSLALEVWANYNRRSLEFIKTHRDDCLLVHVDAVAQNEAELVRLIRNKLNIPLSERAASTFDPEMLRKEPKGSSRSSMIRKCFPAVYDVWLELESTADMKFGSPMETEDDKIGSMTEMGEQTLRDWMELRRAQTAQAQAEKAVKEVETKLAAANDEINWIKNSRVWKLRGLLASARKSLSR